MAQCVIAALALTTLIWMSWRANARFVHVRQLPMQWSLSGDVNWTAPRSLALAFTPCLAAIVLGGTTLVSFTMSPRAGQEGMVVPVIALMALTLVGAHAFHLWLVGRTIRAD